MKQTQRTQSTKKTIRKNAARRCLMLLSASLALSCNVQALAQAPAPKGGETDSVSSIAKYIASRTYLRVGGGWSWDRSVKVSGHNVTPQQNNFFMYGVGFRFFNPLQDSAQLKEHDGPNPFRAEWTMQHGSNVDIRAPANVRYRAKTKVWTANLYYDFLYENLQKLHLTPYVSLGIGRGEFSSVRSAPPGSTTTTSSSGTASTAVSGGAGLILSSNQWTSLDVGYKYLHVGTLKAPQYKTGINAHQLGLSLVVLF